MSIEVDRGLQTAVKSGVYYGYYNEGAPFDVQRRNVRNSLMAWAQFPKPSTGLIDASEEAIKVYTESVSMIVSNGLGRAIEVLKLYTSQDEVDNESVDFMHGEVAKRVLAQEAEQRISMIDNEYFQAVDAYIQEASLPFIKRKLAERAFGRNGYRSPGYLLMTKYLWEKKAGSKTAPSHMHATGAVQLLEEHQGTVQEAVVKTINSQVKDEFAVTYMAFRTLNESRLLGLDLESRGISYE